MVTRILLAFFTCLFLSAPAVAASTSGSKNIFDEVDTLTCAQVEVVLDQPPIADDASVDARYLRRVFETYALLSRCALNKPTRVEFYDAVLRGMVAALGDPHSEYLNEEDLKESQEESTGQFFGIGTTLEKQPRVGAMRTLKVLVPRPGAPADKAGLKSGDIVTKINDRFVTSYKNVRAALEDIKGPRGTTVKLLVIRDGVPQPFVLTIARDEIKTEFYKTTLLPSKWFVAKIKSFEGKRVVETKMLETCLHIHSEYKKALKREPNIRGFVLDLRDNPGGFLDGAQCAVDLFATESLRGKALISIETRDGLKAHESTIDPKDMLRGKPLVVLVNEGSASASEIVAKAVQYYNLGVVVGTKTFGKGSIQIVMPLSDERTAVKYTYAQYLVGPTSAPTPVQGVGVTPNIFARARSDGSEKAAADFRESDLVGALPTSTVAKDLVIQRTKETNPALYTEIYNLITKAPFNMEVTDELLP
ncbi:MAG: Carboxyl-terminal protease [Candidatus Giovannonibacteria bacterium GW2011_GWA2_53_7]|uniref:Carboxyl-terminal protease n=1 Tax=Candidatus Giovannonibacteria bacterium GW2011_GWA2_53_7 TaxID=1618650 RepID=A0A0G2A7Q4_9BACT|nr:MAG: Carboxyl-terminal protease [Candidatus Giovannonibacteria bacterium GW2011_GWA2_53_7]